MSGQNWLRGRTIVYNPAPKPQPPQRVGVIERILGTAWSALKKTCMVIGFIILSLCVLTIWSASQVSDTVMPSLPKQMVLTLDLRYGLDEANSATQYLSLLNIEGQGMTLDDIIDALDRAKTDKSVKALAVRVASSSLDLSQLEQLRRAVANFKTSGKKTAIYAESYGDGGAGLGLYYLASVFDEIWLQPVGIVSIGGMAMESPFFKKIMDKYGVEAQFFHRKEYKNAMEHLTDEKMSDKSREMMEGLVGELAAQLVEPIKKDRPKLAATFDALVDKGLITDKEALKAGLVDHVDYDDVMIDKMDKGLGMPVDMNAYWTARSRKDTGKRIAKNDRTLSVAVIHVDGMIVSGSPEQSPYGLESAVSGGDDIAADIDDAANDPRIAAIILKVNSPGGVPSASETIHRAVVRAQTKYKKPVIVSMGAMAASGGYWISAGASKIYALNTTLTGSIGVVGGKINLQKFWEKYDVVWDGVKYGENSGMMSINTPFSPSEQAQFEASLDSVYDTFIDHVAKGRKLKAAEVEKIAKGHVWTGREAQKIGLVDEIGGLDKVLDDLATAKGLTSRRDIKIIHMPEISSPLDMLYEIMSSAGLALSPDLSGVISKIMLPIMGSQAQDGRLVYDGSLPRTLY
ncbi:MAG: signal peptide peptidase SppA [Pseudobdellovibrionaceae bacterium]